MPGFKAEKISIEKPTDVPNHLWDFMNRFDIQPTEQKQVNIAQGLFGYTTYDAVQFFDSVKLTTQTTDNRPLKYINALSSLSIRYCAQSF